MKSSEVYASAALGAAVIALLVAGTPLVYSPDTMHGVDPQTDEGWVSLFNGLDLDDWEATKFGGEGEVAVEDQSIFLDFGAYLTGVHRDWPLPRSNYELELEARRIDGSDFFCGLTFPVKDDHCSLILGGWGGGVVGLSSLDGYDASENETTQYMNFDQNQWYHIRLRVTDDEIEAWLDGEQIIAVELEGRRISVRYEVELSEPFGICSFETQAGVRNLRARSITAATE